MTASDNKTTSKSFTINEPPPPIVHTGTGIFPVEVVVLTGNRLIIEGHASLNNAAATGTATFTHKASSGSIKATLGTSTLLAGDPNGQDGSFDLVIRPIAGTNGIIAGDTVEISGINNVPNQTFPFDIV